MVLNVFVIVNRMTLIKYVVISVVFLLITACNNSNGSSTIKDNKAPIAEAGVDQTIEQGSIVTFDASESSDSDGEIISYEWKEGNVVLSTASLFTKDDFLLGTHTIVLTVTDNNNLSHSDTIIISIVAKGEERAFVSTWEASLSCDSTKHFQVYIPTTGEGYNYNIDWGDGTSDTSVEGNITHKYPDAGYYQVEITGDFPRIYFADEEHEDCVENATKIQSVEQWGTIKWKSMGGAFTGCTNLTIDAQDSPNLSEVTDMAYMFSGATELNANIGEWDVSTIRNMEYMFQGATSFNKGLGSWDLSNVVDVNHMFNEAGKFNQDISEWNISKVEDMSFMFFEASEFNQDISKWNVSSVKKMSWTFAMTGKFDQDLSAWDVSNVENMFGLFYEASEFNQDIGSWKLDSLKNAAWMFARTKSFNQDISSWNVSSVTNMDSMFSKALKFNQNIGAWDVSKVTIMKNMFNEVTLSVINYDALLNGWSGLSLQRDVDFNAGNSKYSNTSLSDKNAITSNFNWTIKDGGEI